VSLGRQAGAVSGCGWTDGSSRLAPVVEPLAASLKRVGGRLCDGCLAGSTGQHPACGSGGERRSKRLPSCHLQLELGRAGKTCSVELPNGWDPYRGTQMEGIAGRRFPPFCGASQARGCKLSNSGGAHGLRGPQRLPLGGLISRIRFAAAELARVAASEAMGNDARAWHGCGGTRGGRR